MVMYWAVGLASRCCGLVEKEERGCRAHMSEISPVRHVQRARLRINMHTAVEHPGVC